MCTTSELRPFIPAGFINNYVAALNERVAPFYAWQSSGLLSVQFEAGQVLETPYEDTTCGDQVYDGRGAAGIAHQFYLYGTIAANEDPVGGRGQVSGPISSIYHPHPRDEAPRAPSGLGLERVLFVSGHELDHNIGVPHFFGRPVGPTRGDVSSSQWQSLGTISDNPAFSRMYSCHSVSKIGWSVGEDRPACLVVPELPSARHVHITDADDGAATVVWQEPLQFDNFTSITGYKVKIQRHNGSTFEVIEQHNVSAARREFQLPQQLQSGRYIVAVQVMSDVGDSLDNSIEFSIFGNEYNLQVRAVTPSPQWYSQNTTMDYPIEYELSWDPVPNARIYEIYSPEGRCPSPGANDLCVTTEPRIVFSESRGELVEGETYSLTIYARFADTSRIPVGVADFTAHRNIPEWWKGRDNTPHF